MSIVQSRGCVRCLPSSFPRPGGSFYFPSVKVPLRVMPLRRPPRPPHTRGLTRRLPPARGPPARSQVEPFPYAQKRLVQSQPSLYNNFISRLSNVSFLCKSDPTQEGLSPLLTPTTVPCREWNKVNRR